MRLLKKKLVKSPFASAHRSTPPQDPPQPTRSGNPDPPQNQEQARDKTERMSQGRPGRKWPVSCAGNRRELFKPAPSNAADDPPPTTSWEGAAAVEPTLPSCRGGRHQEYDSHIPPITRPELSRSPESAPTSMLRSTLPPGACPGLEGAGSRPPQRSTGPQQRRSKFAVPRLLHPLGDASSKQGSRPPAGDGAQLGSKSALRGR